MSQFVYVRTRAGEPRRVGASHIETLAQRLTPSNLPHRPARVYVDGDALLGILGPSKRVSVAGTSACLGSLFGDHPAWSVLGSEAPDGCYALVRSGAKRVELVADAVGSRTIWYAHERDVFIASSSQRALVMLLESYEPNHEAFAWTLSSGTLGPASSWDRRVRALPAAGRLTLDASTWTSSVTVAPVEFSPIKSSAAEHCRALARAVEGTLDGLDLDSKDWVLPLSGGYDSRLILLGLKDRSDWHAITWGLRAAASDRHSDAFVARDLAARLGVSHRYFPLDLEEQRVEEVLERFVTVGEGRTDRITGYLDGFDVWRQLNREGRGVLRGDEAFGCRAADGVRAVHANMSCTVLADFPDAYPGCLADLCDDQKRPRRLERRSAESLAAWRDRLNLEFEFPFVMAALNDLKLAYVDVIHPLVSARILRQVRQMPDSLRTDKNALKTIIDGARVGVPIAKRPAVATAPAVLARPAVECLIKRRLTSVGAGDELLSTIAEHAFALLARWRRQPRSRRLVGRVRSYLPRARETGIHPLKFAFRAYIVACMQRLLAEDARALRAAAAFHPATLRRSAAPNVPAVVRLESRTR